MQGKTRRRAVIVLGMHRSGTSAVTGAAIRLGLAPPKTRVAPTQDNPTGFHESVPLVALNALILQALGCNWYDCLAFDPGSLDASARAAAFATCAAILREEFADEPAFVVKEPQLCLTLPIWLPPLRESGADVRALLVVRHPDEVARSLFWRDMLPEADTAAVWLHHMLEAERMTRGLPRAVVLYADLLRDWRACMERAGRVAAIAWPNPCTPNAGDVVIPSFRHHVAATHAATVGPPSIRDLVNETWMASRQLNENPADSSVQARLDLIRARFALWRLAPRGGRTAQLHPLRPRPTPHLRNDRDTAAHMNSEQPYGSR